VTKRAIDMPAQVARARKTSSIAVASHARLRGMRSSAQKARLVVNEIRGKRVDEARAFLRNCRKRAASSLLKLLESAAENVRNDEKAAALYDLDELYVTRVEVGDGRAWRRLQPAPMGRAYQTKRRTCNVVLELGALDQGKRAARGGRKTGSTATARKPSQPQAAAR